MPAPARHLSIEQASNYMESEERKKDFSEQIEKALNAPINIASERAGVGMLIEGIRLLKRQDLKMILLMRAVYNLSIRQIAKKTGISRKRVEALEDYGIKRVKDILSSRRIIPVIQSSGRNVIIPT